MPNPSKARLATIAPVSVFDAATAMVSRHDFARMIGRSIDTVDRLAITGNGPRRFKLRGRWYYRRADIEAWQLECLAADDGMPRKRKRKPAIESVANNEAPPG
jgi:hypothetical protein